MKNIYSELYFTTSKERKVDLTFDNTQSRIKYSINGEQNSAFMNSFRYSQ